MLNAAPIDPVPPQSDDLATVDDGIESGKRLIRLPSDTALTISERIANQITRLTWRTPLHALRLKGRFPLKLLGVPHDPVPGDAHAGSAIRAGYFQHRGLRLPIHQIDFAALDVAPAFGDYLHSFAWLRDLGAVANRAEAAPIAEAIVRQWLAAHGERVSEPAWKAENSGWRILYWASHAPLILSSSDLVYRSAVLNHLARTARHLDRVADKGRPGTGQMVAWVGVVAASLLLPGGDGRQVFGEAGLRRVLGTSFYSDGGNIARSPQAQLDAVMALSMLVQVYDMRRMDVPAFIKEVLQRAVPALLGVVHSDGSMGNWQGSGAISAERIQAIVGASGIRTRPLKQARDWGYQRLVAAKVALIVDAAPPPVSRLTEAGCASTLAFEMSDGDERIVVNCGGAGLAGATIPADLAHGLRTTAAHSTLTLEDSNSTAVLPNGALGKGVTEVELDRRETPQGSRLEMSHDGYVKRQGLIHRRLLILAPNGRELRGEDMLLPAAASRKRGEKNFALRFHLGPEVGANLTNDKLGALLRLGNGALWQFRASDGQLEIEESLWVDGNGRPYPSHQLVISGVSPAGGTSIGWIFKHIG
jgi:uncharacterized heparinase superfamily protein